MPRIAAEARTATSVPIQHAAILASTLLLAAILAGACNTMEGVGQDVRSGGRALEDTAEDAAN